MQQERFCMKFYWVDHSRVGIGCMVCIGSMFLFLLFHTIRVSSSVAGYTRFYFHGEKGGNALLRCLILLDSGSWCGLLMVHACVEGCVSGEVVVGVVGDVQCPGQKAHGAAVDSGAVCGASSGAVCGVGSGAAWWTVSELHGFCFWFSSLCRDGNGS